MPQSVTSIRKTEVLIDGKWVFVHIEQLNPNDIFRMWEANGKRVVENGAKVFICRAQASVKCDPFHFPDDDGTLT